MRVPVPLINAFKDGFEPVLTDFLLQKELIPEPDALNKSVSSPARWRHT